MLGRDTRAGRQRLRPLAGWVRRDRLDPDRSLPHAPPALVQRASRPLRALELVPLCGERAPDLADEGRRLGACPRDDSLSPALRRRLRLAGLGQLRGGFGARALDLVRALGVRAGVGIERRQQI